MKKKFLITSAVLSFSAFLSVGAFVGIKASKKGSVKASAATATTVYYAIETEYTVKCNVKLQGDQETWAQYPMTLNGETFGTLPVYSVNFTDLYDGVAVLQFQLYNGEQWISQVQPISDWTGASTYNGKIWNDGSWKTYTPDPALQTVTKYAVISGEKQADPIGTEKVVKGATYEIPAAIYQPRCSFDGWYTNEACTSEYTAVALNADLDLYGKYTHNGGQTGTINVDLSGSSWAEASANYAVLLMNKVDYEEEVDAWSTYKMGSAEGYQLVQISYDIGFIPKEMLVVRYNPSYSQSDWETEKFPGKANRWGQTYDFTFDNCVRIGAWEEGDDRNYGYAGSPKVIGGSGWVDMEYLQTAKLNGSHHAEFYSDSVFLQAGTEFKIQVAPYHDEDYYNSFSTHDSIADNFSGGEGNDNIVVETEGTYAFYFDATACHLYITKVELAEADEWAQYFLDNAGCDATGDNLPSGWADVAAEYAELSPEAKAIIIAAEADAEGGYVEQAVAKYDHALAHHGNKLTAFIVGRPLPSSINANYTPAISFSSNSTIVVITMIAVASVTVIGVTTLIKVRKER